MKSRHVFRDHPLPADNVTTWRQAETPGAEVHEVDEVDAVGEFDGFLGGFHYLYMENRWFT